MVALVTAGAFAGPASAAVQVYTNQALFDSQRPGITSNSFSFPGTSAIYVGQTYTQAGVNFSVPTGEGLYELPADATLTSPHLAALPGSVASPTISMAFAGPVLGLTLASYYQGQTVSYNVNGTTGTLTLPANEASRFIGFDTGSLTPINATFTFLPNTSSQPSSIDVVSFQTALPEPAAWLMMIVGAGLVGAQMRRRRTAAPRVAFAG